jgi:hypothetical protein
MIRQAGATMATQANSVKFFRPRVWRSSLAQLTVLVPIGAHAAPFCLGSEAIPPQCIYYDANSCSKEAIRQGGACSANPKEVRITTNVGQYCVVTSQQVTLCYYSDRGSCTNAAARQQGVCISRPDMAPSAAPDPFSSTAGN